MLLRSRFVNHLEELIPLTRMSAEARREQFVEAAIKVMSREIGRAHV